MANQNYCPVCGQCTQVAPNSLHREETAPEELRHPRPHLPGDARRQERQVVPPSPKMQGDATSATRPMQSADAAAEAAEPTLPRPIVKSGAEPPRRPPLPPMFFMDLGEEAFCHYLLPSELEAILFHVPREALGFLQLLIVVSARKLY